MGFESGLLGYQVGNGPCLGVGLGDQHEGCCKVQARDTGARPRVVAVGEEPCWALGLFSRWSRQYLPINQVWGMREIGVRDVSDTGLAGKDWRGWRVGGLALGLPSLRSPLDGHREQAVGGSVEFRGAPSGWRWRESEWRERRGAEDRALGSPWFCQGKAARRGCLRGRRALGGQLGAKWGACMVRMWGGVKCGEDWLEGWGPGAPKPQPGHPAWGSPGLPSWLWLLPSQGLVPLPSRQPRSAAGAFLLPAWLRPGL